MRPQSPNEAQPVVTRIRMRYSKTGRMRFGSARDFQRALERAVRRAALPVAMSGGFNPHPRISYANAVPTGTASLAEYVEIALAEERSAADVLAAVNDGLPDGFLIEQAIVSPGGAVADRLEASRWRIEYPGRSTDTIEAAIREMWQRAPVTVSRVTKSGPRDIAVTDNWIAHRAADARLIVIVRSVTPTVRPDDITRAIGLEGAALATREAQGPVVAGDVGDPLA